MHQWRELEPEGRGHELMLAWGLYRRGGERDHSAVTSGHWSEPLDKATDAEPPYIVTLDRMLRDLNLAGYEHSIEITKRFYLAHPRLALWDLAEKVHRTESFCRLTLRGICALAEQKVPE